MRTFKRAAVMIALFLALFTALAALNSAYYQYKSQECHEQGGDRVNGICQKVQP